MCHREVSCQTGLTSDRIDFSSETSSTLSVLDATGQQLHEAAGDPI